ncbi:MAG: S9 family peptidase [Chloroflexi bacterium]|uniref:alpha/beta hydrolase family protein n=1 Tax=Candidatus Flexifilum breve TaxID=3140694 RepID=UPI0031366908|nr:S9 family peptidase [Chloroflexota bacterium]
MYKIESFLSARLFLAPQRVGDHIYFVSNLSGRLSLYVMRFGGSVPQPLLPPTIALQNPELIGGYPFYVFPKIGQIMVMIDRDGDENYQPMLIPIGGGFPEPALPELGNARAHCTECDIERNLAYFNVELNDQPLQKAYQADMATGAMTYLGESTYGIVPIGVNATHDKVALVESYTMGDDCLFLWEQGKEDLLLLCGIPIGTRAADQDVPLNAINATHFTERGLVFITALFEDTFGLGYLDLKAGGGMKRVTVTGAVHSGVGELVNLDDVVDNRYSLIYNIDGASWVYEGEFDEAALTMRLTHVIAGQGELAGGVLHGVDYEPISDSFSFSFSTATSPTQLYTVSGADRQTVTRHTDEAVLGIPAEVLAPGEDASFISHDGLRISARLYLPAPSLGFAGKRPLVYYIHGGPQSQERPDFSWFSMPLIQYLTLNGFAVFVPNVRGSTGYGLDYTKRIDKDWGGQDRLDHVHALKLLADHPRVDPSRAGVVGRSYGGYMTLIQAFQHPDLWKAAVDMFGPYDLFTFSERIPETWKPYFYMALGHPEKDRDLLTERSPRTYVDQLACPMLVIQGKNDPRVVERESHDVVEYLRSQGKEVDYLMFENEGHDVLKLENRVTCYNAITEHFKKHL